MALKYYGMGRAMRDEVTEDDRRLPIFATLLHNMGLVHMNLGRPEDALGYFQESLDSRGSRADGGGISECDNDVLTSTVKNMGVAHLDLGRTRPALSALSRSLDLMRAAPDSDPRDVAETLDGIARIRQELGDHDAALAAYKEAMQLEGADRDGPALAATLCSIAQLQHARTNLGEALRAYQEAWRVMTGLMVSAEGAAVEDSSYQIAKLVSVLSAITSIHLERGEIEKAKVRSAELLRIQGASPGPSSSHVSSLNGWGNMSAPAA